MKKSISVVTEGTFLLPETEVLTETVEKASAFTAVTEESTKEAILGAINYETIPENTFKHEDGMKLQYHYTIDKESSDLVSLFAKDKSKNASTTH